MEVMQRLDWDEELVARALALLCTLAYCADGLQAVAQPDAVLAVVAAAEAYAARQDMLAQALTTLGCVASSTQGCEALALTGGVGAVIRLIEQNMEDAGVVLLGIDVLVRVSAVEALSTTVAEQGAHAVVAVCKRHDDAPAVLIAAFQLINLMAFVERNLQVRRCRRHRHHDHHRRHLRRRRRR